MIKKQIVALLSAAVLSACGPSPWESAKKADSIETYQSFVAAHADSEFAAAARKRIEELSWAAVTATPTIDGYDKFLKSYSDSPNATAARTALVGLRWARAESTNTIDAYADFARTVALPEQTARARAAVKSIGLNAPKAQPGNVRIEGVFADNMTKYVSVIEVAYNGMIAGYPAKIRYTVRVTKSAKGQQEYFVFNDSGTSLAMSAPAEVKGMIELSLEGKPVKFELSRIASGPAAELGGSFLVALKPPMLWSDVTGLTLFKTTHNDAAEQLAAGEAVLFEVQPDFTLLYIP
jgi:hypothetical protein